jgi:hypothetical protein
MVYKLEFQKNKYILKINAINESSPSPFWMYIMNLFGYNFYSHIENLNEISKKLENKYIQIAKPVYINAKEKSHLYYEIEGIKYEPDIFPSNKDVFYQLGEYIGYIHKTTYEYYGTFIQKFNKDSFGSKLKKVIEELIFKSWHENEKLFRYLGNINFDEITCSEFSLIMPDISANQFIFSKDLNKIAALVDLDAYIIGPQELELTILEMCIPDKKCAEYFHSGYERHRKFPEIENVRHIYRLLTFVCGSPDDSPEIDQFLNENIFW